MTEDRYTLDEAKALLAEEECHRHGHDLNSVRTGAGDTLWVYCSNCPARFAPTRPDYRELRASLLGRPGRGDRQAHCPDELLTLVGAIAPRPTPDPTGEPTVEQWAGQIRMVADQIWREAFQAGSTYWAEREPTRIVLDGPAVVANKLRGETSTP